MYIFYNYIYIFLISLMPSLVWLWFALKQDIHPEKLKDIIYVFFLGIFIAIPVLWIAAIGKDLITFFSLDLNQFVITFLFGALNEEVIKFIVFYIFVFKSKFCDEPIDIFVYASTLALGFAGIENIFVSLNNLDSTYGSLETILLLRTISAVAVHLISTFLFAYGIYMYKNTKSKINLFIGALLSVGFHTIYNFVLALSKLELYEISTYIEYIYILIFFPMFIYMIYLVSKLKKASK